jgi:hydroxymethylglutaryl-CoA synthase
MTAGLGVHEMAIAAPCEDVVTLAASAGLRCLRRAGVDPNEIGLLLVATETGVDHSKPVSIFVHELLGIGRHCRVYELKHACYGGTAALMTAADWVRAGGTRRRKALVIASDIARYELRSAGEPTQGAGAVAMLVGNEPRVLALDAESGTFAANVYDFWRPFGRREALVDGKFSVDCYLDALSGAFLQYRALERPALGPEDALSDRLTRLLYHTPFPKMASKAHRRLIELDWRAAGRGEADDESIAASFRTLAAPGIEAVSHIGNTYTASLYFCLAGILEREARMLAGRRIGLFSYGSGCCAEFFTGTMPTGAEAVADAGLRELLGSRTMIDMEEYERLMTTSELGGEPPSAFTGEFVFQGVRNDRREYGRLRASMAA